MCGLALSPELVAQKCCSLFLSSREFSGNRHIKNCLKNGAFSFLFFPLPLVIPACLFIHAQKDAA